MDWFDCWSCGLTFAPNEDNLCAYKPVGSVVAYDVCPDCWDKLTKDRDED